jgi:CheY-like chemotaxis protein
MSDYDNTVDSLKKSLFTDSMALRVLLADESSTIKKVMQLTLQDFDVDVRGVSIGLDVLSVTKTFRPDIIFADVLLAKRSGYEVCHDLKNDPATNQIPVVLMWSGFMEIDEQKARMCGADRRLEKPFDPSELRDLVQELVRKTRDNPVSSFIQFPPIPEFQESPPAQTPPQPQAKIEVSAPKEDSSSNLGVTIDNTESIDEWVQQPPPKASTAAGPKITFPLNEESPSLVLDDSPHEEFAEFSLTAPSEQHKVASQISAQVKIQNVDPDIVREEIQKWLATNMAPLAEKIIREEINRLLQDNEQTIEAQ